MNGENIACVPRTAVGRGYTVVLPQFIGDGTELMCGFYETLFRESVDYFEKLGDRCGCRCHFVSAEHDGTLSVTVTLTLRAAGEPVRRKVLVHTWKAFGGVWLLCGKKSRLRHRFGNKRKRGSPRFLLFGFTRLPRAALPFRGERTRASRRPLSSSRQT